jgi:hypothetical protein
VTFAVRHPNVLKLLISTQFSTGPFYCNWILYGSFVMPADIYRSGLVNIKHFLEAYNPLNNWRTSQKQPDSLLCATTARSSALWSHRSNQRHEMSKSRTLKCTNTETIIQTIECLTDCPTEDRHEQTARQRAFWTHSTVHATWQNSCMKLTLRFPEMKKANCVSVYHNIAR